jgi:AmpD protein
VIIQDPDGVIAGARQCPSPHADARPTGCGVELVVLHGISLPPGRFGGPWIERLFTGQLLSHWHPYLDHLRQLRVSSHLLIRRGGELVQFVPLAQRAWHAGASRFGNRERCNDFAVGIELEGDDDTPYTEPQYACLVPLLSALMRRYAALTPDRVVGHEHIAPGRKTDPGRAFDWARLERELGIPAPVPQPAPTRG